MKNKIEIFDNEVPFNHMQNIYEYVKNSNYRLGWGDRDEFTSPANIHSVYSKDEVIDSELFKYLKRVSKKSKLKFNIDNFHKCVVNLSKSGDYHFNHAHNGKMVLLYYVNLEWKDGYAGETLFYDNSLINAESVVSFVPGRIIIFDGETPHTIRPQSTYGPDYRFTISYFVNKE
tara:strand:- start:184 stop:705 length:522 start_codon:yes stop_codon:yes gene_type:complete